MTDSPAHWWSGCASGQGWLDAWVRVEWGTRFWLVNLKSRPSSCWLRGRVSSLNTQLCSRTQLAWEPSRAQGWVTLANQLLINWCSGWRKAKWVFPARSGAVWCLPTSHFLTCSAPFQFIAAYWGLRGQGLCLQSLTWARWANIGVYSPTPFQIIKL